MQMVRLNITKRHNPAVEKPAEHVDLDEKIRRIREANKQREQRFLEIEQDKKLASDSANKESLEDNIHTEVKSKPCRNSAMKGVVEIQKKTAKGRGQRLLEMSHHPLKAEIFETRTKHEFRTIGQSLPEEIKLLNYCRSKIRERIQTRNKEEATTVSVVENETPVPGILSTEDKLHCIPQDQSHEIAKDEILLLPNKEIDNITQEIKDTQQHEEKAKIERHEEDVENSIIPCNIDQQKTIEMKEIAESVEQQEKLRESKTQKNDDKPQITVKLKKTESSSSFDESIAMLSPLDCPQNWGDLDFSDDDLPAVSIWTN